MTSSTAAVVERPPGRYPLRAIAAQVSRGIAVVTGLIATLATFGVLTVGQRDALTAAGVAIDALVAAGIGLLPVLAAVASAFRTATTGEPHVTPSADPRADDGTPLVPDGGVIGALPDVSFPGASER